LVLRPSKFPRTFEEISLANLYPCATDLSVVPLAALCCILCFLIGLTHLSLCRVPAYARPLAALNSGQYGFGPRCYYRLPDLVPSLIGLQTSVRRSTGLKTREPAIRTIHALRILSTGCCKSPINSHLSVSTSDPRRFTLSVS